MLATFRSLVFRIVLGTAAIYAAVTATLLLITWVIVRSGFASLEDSQMLQHRQRVDSALAEEKRSLTALCREWGGWDLTVEFLAKPTEEFIEYNLAPEWRRRVDLDLILFVRNDGSVPWGSWLVDGEFEDTVRENAGWTPGLDSLMPAVRGSMASLAEHSCGELLAPSTRGALNLSLCPVLRSDFTGDPSGAVVFGRLLSAARVEDLARATQTHVEIVPAGPSELAQATGEPRSKIERLSSSISIPLALRYEGSSSGLVVRIHEDRGLWGIGRRTLLLLGLNIALGGLALALALLYLIRTSVLSPVGAIARHMRRFLVQEDHQMVPVAARNDELGQLVDDYASLLRRIKDRSTQLQHANDQLESIAHTDRLTGLANRRMFDLQSTREVWRMRRDQDGSSNRRLLGVILCDVDCFKLYNDSLGHLAGDACLGQIGRALQSSLRRSGDMVFRYGGEEFVLLLPGCDLKGAEKIAEIARANVEALAVPHPASSVAPVVTISLGVAVALVDEAFSMEELMESADRVLYSAKAAGRNRVVLAEGSEPQAT